MFFLLKRNQLQFHLISAATRNIDTTENTLKASFLRTMKDCYFCLVTQYTFQNNYSLRLFPSLGPVWRPLLNKNKHKWCETESFPTMSHIRAFQVA
jgi:hypothetical protein